MNNKIKNVLSQYMLDCDMKDIDDASDEIVKIFRAYALDKLDLIIVEINHALSKDVKHDS